MAAVSWKSAVSANWTTIADWSTGAVPASTDDVTIGVAGAYTVTLTTPAITVNSITVSDVNATLAVADPGGTDKVTAGFSNSGTVDVDVTGTGGTSVAIGGTLTNSGTLVIGNSSITKASTVTAAALANTGTIDLIGGTAAATLDVTGAAPASLTGDYILQGNALVDLSSGGVTSIAGNAELVLDGAQSRVALGTATTTNSGLTALTSNAGTLALQLGSKITTGGAFTNKGLIEVDNDIFGTGDAGGSGLTFGGKLTNNGDLDIGNSGLTTAVTVTAAGLSNAATATISLTGGTTQATLDITGAAPTTLTGFFFFQGNALLEFASGHITGIGTNSELSLDGAQSRIALSSATTTNSALTLLAGNSGLFDLENHAAVTTTTAFANRNTLDVDVSGASAVTGGNGGSRLTFGGVLTNTGDLAIGNSSLRTATQVTVAGLSNTGTIDLAGLTGRATLDSTGAAPAAWTGVVNLSGNALLEFASGSATSIAAGAELSLNGPRARVALNSDTTTSGALAKLASNAGSLILAGGASVTTTVGLTNSSTLNVEFGSSLTIGGTLTNNGFSFNVGNTGLGAATTVAAAGLANTGTINLTGGTAAATLDITAAAPTTLTGNFNLAGNALLEFASGGVTAIGSGSQLTLNEAKALVALSTALTSDSALTGLATNAGTLNLENGTALTTTVGLTNADFVEVDNGGSSGGSSLTIGGTLTNQSSLFIGNTGLGTATTVTAAGLANTGTINLTGGTAAATLDITAAAPATLTGNFNLSGDALLEFASGGVTALGSGSQLTLNGVKALVALSTALTKDSALTGLATNAGTLNLENGTALTTTVGLTNTDFVEVDNSFGGGGSSLTIGKTLTNQSSLNIGSTGLSKATTVTAAALTNSSFINLASGTAAATLKVTGAFGNTATVEVDNSFGGGGSNLTIGGTLTNSSFSFNVGNTGLTKATTVTAAGLANTGTINLTGGTAAATLDITAAAPATLTGNFNLAGDALLEFASGGVTALGAGTDLTLNGAKALVALSTALTSDSALTGLANNAGTLNLENGTVLTTTVGLTNSATVEVDNSFGTSSGGSSLTIGGTLTNQSSLDIGSTGLGKATTVTAAALTNSSFINLASGTAAATLKITGAFGNTATVEVDNSFGGGGSNLAIGGTLTNSGFSFNVGNTGLTKATTVTAAGLANTGTINLTGGTAAQATLDITAAAPATLTGNFNLSGDALLEFASGGITALGSGSQLTLNGAKALVALSTALTSDSALTGLTTNAGTLNLENGTALTTTVGLTNSANLDVDSGFGATGGSSLTIGGTLTNQSSLFIGNTGLSKATTVTAAALTNSSFINLTSGTAAATLKVTGAFGNTATVEVDNSGSGGSRLMVGGTLTNSSFSFNVGNTGLTKATTVTAAGLANTGTINLTGGTAAGTLDITAAAPATLTGNFNLSGDALLEFASGGITAIGSGTDLTLNGAKALVALSTALTSDSALTGLATNAGTLNLENGAVLTTTVGLTNSSVLEVDNSGNSPPIGGGGGGSSLTIGGTLTNQSFLGIGNPRLTKATSVTANALANNTSIALFGGTGANTATLTATGASTDSGSITVNTGGILALGNTLTVFGSLDLQGGTISGGTLATSGSGGMGTGPPGLGSGGTLSAVTIGAGSTFAVGGGDTLTVKGVTVSGALSGPGVPGPGATLDFASTGTDSLTNVSGFATIGLASGAANTLTLATANFAGTSGVITVNDGNSGNTVSGSTLTSSDSITVHAGTGADTVTGGAGNDIFYAGGDTKMTGGGGTNQFIFNASGAATNTIADFGASPTNELVFSNIGFSLGLTGATSTPQQMTLAEAATLFTANSTGAFANTSQRLAYDTANGELFSSTNGSGGTSHLVATLTSEPSVNTANPLFFIS